MENKNFFFSFLNMGINWKKFDPSFFPIFSGTRQTFFEKNKVFLKASIFDVLMIKSLLGVDPTQSYGENTKYPIQDFIDFLWKPIKKWEEIFKIRFLLFQFKIIKI